MDGCRDEKTRLGWAPYTLSVSPLLTAGRVGMLDRCQRQKQPRTERWGRRQRQIKEGLCCPDLLRPTPPTPPDRVRLPEGRRGIWGGGGGGEAADTETSEGCVRVRRHGGWDGWMDGWMTSSNHNC